MEEPGYSGLLDLFLIFLGDVASSTAAPPPAFPLLRFSFFAACASSANCLVNCSNGLLGNGIACTG